MTAQQDGSCRIETLARNLCASEGWNPDEIIACEPEEVAGAQQDDASGQWACRRWQAYVRAAERLASEGADDWDDFQSTKSRWLRSPMGGAKSVLSLRA